MKVTGSIQEAREWIGLARRENRTVGFVPTMGYLHRGHISLVKESALHSDFQVMSIFVNRKQFNNIHDFDTYPKDTSRDLELAEAGGVDMVYMPDDREMYHESLTSVHLNVITEHLCGAHRPGHFDGVFLVVSKLFNIIQPDIAVFGQKDIQQALGIKKMVLDLNFPVEIIISPIVREEDGLAMSSRNKHLDAGNRAGAALICKSLKRCEELIMSGERGQGMITSEAMEILRQGSPEKIEYYTMARFSDLSPVDTLREKSVLAVAAYFGTTRLIDNMIIEYMDGKVKCIY